MLVLSRKIGETICIGSNIDLVVLEVNGARVKLGFSGPRDVPVRRGEIVNTISLAKTASSIRGRSAGELMNQAGKPAIAPLRAYRMAGAS